MTLVADLQLPELDPTDPELKGERWHEAMRQLRDSGEWLARAPLATVILDREAGEFFLRTKAAIFPGVLLADLFGVTEGPLREEVVHNIINVNSADHGRLRRLVNPALAPRAVERYRPVMREILAELWGDVAGAGRCDLVESLTRPYPARVIAAVMGAPDEDADRLHDWSMWIQRQFDAVALGDPEQLATINRKVAEFYDWVRPLIATRRDSPADDLISTLITAEEEGDKLSAVELENLVLDILVGGVDTSQSQLAHALRLLAERPEQWAALRRDPDEMAPRAVEEAIRFEPITPFTARLLTEEVEHRGVTFPEGTVVVVCAFSANRDPQAFSGAEDFDITAPRESARALTFGAGIHFCVGANLARAEIGEALTFLARRIEMLEPDGEAELQNVSGIYGVESLPVRFA
ncbi:MAG: cytochrome P450 [Solirubrobacterales bacterium]|nr:cytochrome P450 [Solirubrobacterales bacterium]